VIRREYPETRSGAKESPRQPRNGNCETAGGTAVVRSPEASEDAELVASALRDTRAYGEIVRRFEMVLKRYVKRLLGPHAQHAEDVIQDAFIKAYINLNSYDRNRALAPWLYRIAHNEAVTFLRKRGAGPLMIDGEDGQLLLERIRAADPPVMSTLADTAGGSLEHALGQLPPHYREVIALRYLEEKSYDEISDILAMPPGTVATRIRRGLQQLKSHYSSIPDAERDGHE
jgi:RNA polymerase sigma-70 factor, ECF subfamily